jgi:hypothetical protein
MKVNYCASNGVTQAVNQQKFVKKVMTDLT